MTDDDPNDSGDRITELLDLAQQRCLERADRGHHLVDAAQFGFRAGRDHYPGSAPGRDQCSGERHAFPIPDRSFVGHRVCGLIDGHRLARERCFLCPQVLDLDETKVCRDLVARFEEHDVARHQFFGRDQTNLPAAQGPGLRGQHVADRVERLLGLAFLNEAEQRIENDNAQNDRRVEPQADHHLDEPGSEQDINQNVVELVQELHERRLLLALRQTVRTVFRQALLRLRPRRGLSRDPFGVASLLRLRLWRAKLWIHWLG